MARLAGPHPPGAEGQALDLNIAANLATATAVVIGIVFGLLQFYQASRKRRDMAAIEVAHGFQTPELRDAFRHVLLLQEPVDPSTIRGSTDLAGDADVIVFAGEAAGTMVYERAINLHTLDRVMGGFLRGAWRRLAPYVEEERRVRGVNYAEWFQWLVERLEEHPVPGKSLGAHVAHRSWTP